MKDLHFVAFCKLLGLPYEKPFDQYTWDLAKFTCFITRKRNFFRNMADVEPITDLGSWHSEDSGPLLTISGKPIAFAPLLRTRKTLSYGICHSSWTLYQPQALVWDYKLEPYVQASSYVEVKVAWRCNTEQWWWAEVEPAKAGPLYRKLGYSDEAIRAFGLDPQPPVGAPLLGAAAFGADSSGNPPLLMEYPDHPRPPITVENVNSVMGKDSKKKVGGKEKHIFWARTECGLVYLGVHLEQSGAFQPSVHREGG